MKLTELAQEIHEIAKQKGWYITKRSPLEIHMLMVSELAEATEEARKGMPDVYQLKNDEGVLLYGAPAWDNEKKPEGEAIEVIDCLIRILDYCGSKNWNVDELVELKMNYNRTRPHRHGGKKF